MTQKLAILQIPAFYPTCSMLAPFIARLFFLSSVNPTYTTYHGDFRASLTFPYNYSTCSSVNPLVSYTKGHTKMARKKQHVPPKERTPLALGQYSLTLRQPY